MSEERKKVSAEQLKVLIEELERNRLLVNRREGRPKSEYMEKWEQLAKKLNSIENGAIKHVTKWQQTLRDWRNNTKKKASKLGGKDTCDTILTLTTLEIKLLALYDDHLPSKAVGIFVCLGHQQHCRSRSLSSENSFDECCQYPSTFTTYTCDTNHKDSSSCVEQNKDDNQVKIKRRRIEAISEDVLNQQNNLLKRLTALEASRQESDSRQNKLLEALAGSLERHAAATAELARAAAEQTLLTGQVLELLRERRRDGSDI